MMRKSGLFAIVLAAAVVAGCGSSDASYAEVSSGTTSASSSRAAAGVSSNYDYAAEMTAEKAYDYDSGTEAVADVYDESTLEEMDPYYNAGDITVTADDQQDASDSKKSSKDKPDDIEEVDTSKKVIRNMNYSVETTDLDALDQAIQAKVSELGGYIENSSIDGSTVYHDGYYLGEDGNTYYDTSYVSHSGNTRQYRYAYYTIRIPAQQLDQFAQAVEEGANVLSQSTSTQDITSSYVDTDSRRKSLEEELQVLNDMAKKAETVEDLIQIESQRSEVRYQLENIKSQLKSMDDRVAYSTVNMDVTEVKVLTDTTAKDLTWQERVSNGFANSCERLVTTSQEIAIGIASNLPMILFYIVIAVILLVLLRLVLVIIMAILGVKRGKESKKDKRDKKGRRAAQSSGKDNDAKSSASADAGKTSAVQTAGAPANNGAAADASADDEPLMTEDAPAGADQAGKDNK